MALHHRLARLERQAQARRDPDQAGPVPTAQLLDRVLLVLSYQGDDPDMLARQEWLEGALATACQRKAEAESKGAT